MEYEDDVSAYLVQIYEAHLPGGVFAATTIDEARDIVEEQVEQAGLDTSVDEWYEIGGRLQYRCPEDVAAITPLRHDQPVTLSPGHDSDGAGLPVDQRGDTLRIDTSDDALETINDAIEASTTHSELEYLAALRNMVRYAEAPGFDAEAGIDRYTPDPDTVDEDALAAELEEIEENLPEELKEERTEEELRELLCEIREEREAIETAMQIDTSEMLQDELDEEE